MPQPIAALAEELAAIGREGMADTAPAMPPLPPYFYGADAGDGEKCWMERDLIEYAQAYAAQEVAREREACAEACEQQSVTVSLCANSRDAKYHNMAVNECAATIRARSTT